MHDIFRIAETDEIKKVKIDIKDKKILTLLNKNSRMPLSEMAKLVMLSRDSVSYRIKKMEKVGIIQHFFPVIDFARLGYYTFRLFVLVEENNRLMIEQFVDYIKAHPNVISLIEYTDRWDFEVVFISKNLEDFDEILINLTTRFPEIIIEKEILETVKEYYNDFLPTNISIYVEGIHHEHETHLEKIDYDEKDLEILKDLCQDSRSSTYDIGAKIGLNADTISYRIKKMQASGIIKHFTILTNVNLLENTWYTLLMRMKTFDKKNEEKFKEYVRQHRFIIMASKTFGNWDVIAYLTTTKSKNLLKTVKEIKIEFSSIIKNYELYLGFREHTYNPFPLILEAKDGQPD